MRNETTGKAGRRQRGGGVAWLLSVLIGVGTSAGWLPGLAGEAAVSGFFPEKLAEMDTAVTAALTNRDLPGGVLWLERGGEVYRKSYGHRSVEPAVEPMADETIFDAASLTKVLATTPAVMRLVEDGRLRLDEPVSAYLPEFTGEGREGVTVRHLLTHTSGLRPGIPLSPAWTGYEEGIRLATAEQPTQPVGTGFRYSDVNFILLGEVVRRVAGESLAGFAERVVYRPLGMGATGFLPATNRWALVAPTERQTNGVVLRGVVHDPTARRMGGVAGHAGLFTTAPDVARYARMLLGSGELNGVRVFQPATVRLMTSVQSGEAVAARRGLGWDIDSPYAGPRGRHFPVGSYGHTGWTGTSLWVDPFSRTFLIFLSNRNHPTEDGTVVALRSRLGTLAAEAIVGFNFAYVPGALPARTNDVGGGARRGAAVATVEVRNGIDVLVNERFARLKGKRVGLITNHTGQDRRRQSTIDLLKEAPEVNLVALFSPEHGIRGQLDDKVADSVDEKTGLPVYSLYGETRKPKAEQLRGLDALVFDLQDIGCRFYTYISTMGLAMEAATAAGLEFVVLDRVNPINGTAVEGPVHAGASSFTAFHAIPVRHGMTVGELARLFQSERGWSLKLTVVPVEGWKREMWFDQTGQPWTNPSPNMRNLAEALWYPGLGLLETAVSVGRGTDTPFEVLGAPYVDDVKLAGELNRAGLAGVRFVPVRFTPRASVFKDKPCGGVYLAVTDREAVNAVEVGLQVAVTLQRLHPGEFALDKLQTLLQHAPTVEAIRAGKGLAEIRAAWAKDLEAFRARRQQVLLYR